MYGSGKRSRMIKFVIPWHQWPSYRYEKKCPNGKDREEEELKDALLAACSYEEIGWLTYRDDRILLVYY
jgi:hypothetical protein